MLFATTKINIINNIIKAVLSDSRFADAKYGNIARLIGRDNGDSPMTYAPVETDGSEFKYIGFDDTYPMVIYHRELDERYAPNNGGFTNRVGEKAIMRMVVYGRGLTLKMTQEELMATIVTNFPYDIPASALTGTGINSLTATLTSSEPDPLSVFATEYRGTPFSLGPTDILFAINYTLDSTFQRGCYNICNCNNT